MRIVINHLTRMQQGCICVAGIDLDTGRHIRPMLRRQLKTSMLARNGGPFDIGCVVDLGSTRYTGKPPAIEDHLFNADRVRREPDMNAVEFWHWIRSIAQPRLKLIFGDDLRQCGRRSYSVRKKKGVATLGCYIAPSRPRLYIQRRDPQSRGRIRMRFSSDEHEFDLPVTDIRLFGPDHVTPDPTIVEKTNGRLNASSDTLFSVGLTRPFKLTPEQPAGHWLQLNNIHFADEPCWKLS